MGKKGGKLMSFRAVVVVGDRNGQVGVGCASAKEIQDAVRKAKLKAIKDSAMIVIRGTSRTCIHKQTFQYAGAIVMLRPAGEGTGVIAGGAVREVLELAGFENIFGKQIGSSNQLNNAMATFENLKSMNTREFYAKLRGTSVEEITAS